MKENIILKADAYKCCHHLMETEGVVRKYAYLEARGGYSPDVLWYGAQMIIQDHFEGVRVEQWMIDDADDEMFEIFGTREYFNRSGWQRIIDEFDGKLPIEICAIPEGFIVPVSNILMSVENTVDGFAWLANWAETILMHVWHPTTVATTSLNYYRIGKKYAEMSGETISPVFMNDFGYRGVENDVAAGRAGSANLLCSIGTDTINGIHYAKKYYGFENQGTPLGVSVKASEHSVSVTLGPDGELNILQRFVDDLPDNQVGSFVIDSYDDVRAANFLTSPAIFEQAKKRNLKIVLRPDSGDPAIKCHEIAEIIWNNIGGTINDSGYKVFNPHYGIIYGDGINLESCDRVLKTVVEFDKFAASNFVFGSGGALLQKCDRDTHRFAFKASAGKNMNGWFDVFKDPKTDSGKRSKKGRLALIKDGPEFHTIRLEELGDRENLLTPIFRNGEILRRQTFNEIRRNVGILS